MDVDFKRWLRQREMSDIQFLCDMADAQVADGHDWGLEQPRASELLKTEMLTALAIKHNACDYRMDMCCHGLKDPENGKPNMKPTIIRSTFPIVSAALLCQGDHQH